MIPRLFTALTIVALAGCAGDPVPGEQMRLTEQAVAQARGLGADDSSEALQLALAKFAIAQKNMAEEDYKRARVLAEQAELDARGATYGVVQLGAMIEIPAAALIVRSLLKHFDFVSIGTNDLIQYTLAIDRTDEAVAHLYEPLHPAVLGLIAQVIETANDMHKQVCVCGEMAGDIALTRLLLGLGLRSFSMHPAQILSVKQEVLRADIRKLQPWAQIVLIADDPASLMEAGK